jgi:hypothetical protein
LIQVPGCNVPPATVPPQTIEEICAAILCPADCGDSDSSTTDGLAGCGWSRKAGGCVYGGRTADSELGIECNSPVTDTATSPPAPAPCVDIACASFCTGECGWSSGKGRCVEGGTTSERELAANLALPGMQHTCPF